MSGRGAGDNRTVLNLANDDGVVVGNERRRHGDVGSRHRERIVGNGHGLAAFSSYGHLAD